MEQSKFFISLNKLPQRLKQRYMEFLTSPYFNKSQSIIRFAGLLMQKDTEPHREKLFEALYPGKVYDARRIPDLMYKSLRLLEEFLEHEQYKEQLWERKINLLTYIREHNMNELTSAVNAEVDEIRSKKPLRDSQYFYEEYLYQSESDKKFIHQARIQEDESLQLKADQLDLFYLSAKLRDSCEMLNRNRIISAGYQVRMLDELMAAVKADFNRYSVIPAITIYYRILLLLQNHDETEHFETLKNDVHRHIQLFAREEQRSLYGYLQNYCIRKVNTGHFEFYQELLDIYKYMMDIDLMGADNKNLQWDLKNMISIALRLQEYDWAHSTILKLKESLPQDIRENAYTYNLANYYYETQSYKKAAKLLQSVEFTDVYYSLDSKSMLLKMYYEQDEEEAFYSLAGSFSAYLQRNKLISKDMAAIYGNMVRYTRKAFVFKTQLPYLRKKNQKNIAALQDKIASATQMANLNWLKKQVSDLAETGS